MSVVATHFKTGDQPAVQQHIAYVESSAPQCIPVDRFTGKTFCIGKAFEQCSRGLPSPTSLNFSTLFNELQAALICKLSSW